jgi:hypothetical protein
MRRAPGARQIRRCGDLHSTKQLAAALGCDPSTISFDFCLRVLQRHWRMNCRHGSVEDAPRRSSAHRWKDAGPVDAVKAVLISNTPEDG